MHQPFYAAYHVVHLLVAVTEPRVAVSRLWVPRHDELAHVYKGETFLLIHILVKRHVSRGMMWKHSGQTSANCPVEDTCASPYKTDKHNQDYHGRGDVESFHFCA